MSYHLFGWNYKNTQSWNPMFWIFLNTSKVLIYIIYVVSVQICLQFFDFSGLRFYADELLDPFVWDWLFIRSNLTHYHSVWKVLMKLISEISRHLGFQFCWIAHFWYWNILLHELGDLQLNSNEKVITRSSRWNVIQIRYSHPSNMGW